MFGRRSQPRRENSAANAAPPTPAAVEVRGDLGVPAERSPLTGPAVVLNGRYEIGRLIGTGGMATVHLARDLRLNREVAIKLFRAQLDVEPDVHLQELEARVVATLNHYALTTLLDAGVETRSGAAPQIYLVMEYVRGSNLRSRIQDGPLSVAEACWLGFDLAEGLDYMHQRGFLHRDVKPANILISSIRSVRPVVAKLTDFGIAAAIGQPDLSEYTVGTAAYLSPEQVEGHDARVESDVYSLGLCLLEAITGETEFKGSVEAAAFARLTRDPVIPEAVPRRVADLLRRMTARDPDDRIGLYEVAVELQQFLADVLLEQRGTAAEVARQGSGADLQRYDVLGTAQDDVFDSVTRVAAHALGARAALLTFDDGGRVLVKSQFSDAGLSLGSELAGDFAPAGSSPWAIPDLLQLETARSHPLVASDLRVRSSAGAPLVTHDGRRLGMLRVLDDRAREYRSTDLTVLADLAGLVMHEMELRLAARRALFPD